MTPATGATGPGDVSIDSHRPRLVAFEVGHASEVASWATSPEEALAWCSFVGHPVPPEVVAGWGTEAGCSAFTLMDGSEMVGYGELWVPDDESEVELARLIVAPHRRNRGYGRQLAEALVDEASAIAGDVFLRVRPENLGAQRVYSTAGFQRVDADLEAEWNAEQPVDYVWMRATEPGGTVRP